MIDQVKTFLRQESGATAIEYGLIAGVIAAAIVAVLVLMRSELSGLFTKTSNGMASANQ